MSLYSTALMAHMAGALGFLVALALEWFSLWQIRRANSLPKIRKRLRLFEIVRGTGMAAMLLVVLSGLYMALTAWRQAWWAAVTLGTLVLLFIPAAVLTGRRISAFQAALEDVSTPADSAGARSLLGDPVLRASLRIRLTLALGILYLMFGKPGLVESLLAIGAAAALGILVSLPLPGSGSPRRGSLPGQAADGS